MKLSRLLPLLALLLPAMLRAETAEKSAVPFRNLGFDAACAAAKTEGKLVFIDFYTTWCEPCKKLDRETWTDAAVGKLVGGRAVALKLDAEQAGRDVAQRYKVNAYPTLLLLKADGTEVDRLVGYREPAKFIEEFNAALAGKPSGVRAVEAVATAKTTREAVQARLALAQDLARRGENAAALKEYLWCFDEGMVQEASFRGVRLSFLLSYMARLGDTYPPAREVLNERCDQAEQRMLGGTGDRQAAMDYAALCSVLKNEARMVATFDRLPAGDPRRAMMGPRMYRYLLGRQRYADALSIRSYAQMKIELELSMRRPAAANPELAESYRRVVINGALDSIEVLAGAGDLEHARELSAQLFAYDASPAIRQQVAERATRAGQADLLKAPAAK